MSYLSGVNTVNEHFNYMATNSPMIVDELLYSPSSDIEIVSETSSGHWIDNFYSLTKSTSSSLSFISWIEKHTLLKKTQAYCYRSFYKNFKDHRKILRSTLSFRWFNKHGTPLIKHFRTSKTLSMEWYSNTY